MSHKKKLTIAFLLTLILLNIGIVSAQIPISIPSNYQSRSGIEQITLQDGNQRTITIDINCTLYSEKFIQGKPIIIAVVIFLPDNADNHFLSLMMSRWSVKVTNAFDADKGNLASMAATTSERFTPIPYLDYNVTLPYKWESSEKVLFQDSGKLNLELNTLYWQLDSQGQPSPYSGQGNFNVTFRNLEIYPSEQQAQISSNPIPSPTYVSPTNVIPIKPVMSTTEWGTIFLISLVFSFFIIAFQFAYDFIRTKLHKKFWKAISENFVKNSFFELCGLGPLIGYCLVVYSYSSLWDIFLLILVVAGGAAIGLLIVALVTLFFPHPSNGKNHANTHK